MVLPIQAIVPIHSTLLIGSTATRVLFFWEHIDWKIAGPFLVGSLFGAMIGARVYVELPEAFVATASQRPDAGRTVVAPGYLASPFPAPVGDCRVHSRRLFRRCSHTVPYCIRSSCTQI